MKRYFTAVMLATTSTTAQDNLILNPGFEEVSNNHPDHWALYDGFQDRLEFSEANPASGSGHIRAIGNRYKGGSFVTLQQTMDGVVSGSAYQFGFEYSKGDFFLPAGDPPVPLELLSPAGLIFIQWMDDNNQPLGSGYSSSFDTANNPFGEYQSFESVGFVAPEGATRAKLRMLLHGGDELWQVWSTLDIDNVSLTAVPAPNAAGTLLASGLLATRRKR